MYYGPAVQVYTASNSGIRFGTKHQAQITMTTAPCWSNNISSLGAGVCQTTLTYSAGMPSQLLWPCRVQE
jgi:hypothetical protein